MWLPINTTYTLIEALERSSGEEEWKKLISLDNECLKRGLILERCGAPVIQLSGRAVADEDILRQRGEILNELEVKLRRCLESGEWVATGFKSPIDSEDTLPLTIQPGTWAILTHLSYTNSATSGGELRFVGLRIKESNAYQSSATKVTDQTSKRTAKTQRLVPELEAALVSRIKAVLASARKAYPDPKRYPSSYIISEKLTEDEPGKKLAGYAPATIRKIIEGTYPPMKRRKIPGFLERRLVT